MRRRTVLWAAAIVLVGTFSMGMTGCGGHMDDEDGLPAVRVLAGVVSEPAFVVAAAIGDEVGDGWGFPYPDPG